MGEGIGSNKEAVRDVDDLQVKVGKIKQPPGLAVVEILGLMEVHQVLVVSEDLDGKGRAVEVMSPRLQSMDDHKEFSVVDVVVSFSRNEGLGEV